MVCDPENFQLAWLGPLEQMKDLAESEGSFFLPGPEPGGPVQNVAICMEPSLGRWARSAEDARLKVKAGFRNFLSSMEDFILHFCMRSYLCAPGERYHITDISKGAMSVERAGLKRLERYDRWYPLLLQEMDLVGAPSAKVVAVGKVVSGYLGEKGFPFPFSSVIHYSGQAGSARNKGIAGREEAFSNFAEGISLKDILEVAEEVLEESHVPSVISQGVLERLAGSQLTVSRKRLAFNYKIAFERIRSEG